MSLRGFIQGQTASFETIFHLLKNLLFSLVGVKGNLSLLEKYCHFFSGGLQQMEVMLFGQTILSDKKSSCSSASKGHVSLCSQAPICRPAALQVTFHRAVLQRSCLGSELSPPDKKKPADTCKLAVTGTAMDPRHKTWIKSFLLGPLKKTFGGFSKFIGGVFILVVCSIKDHKKKHQKNRIPQ